MRILVIAGVLAALHTAARADDPTAAEARRRNDELVKRGFNLTHGLTVTPAGARIEMWVPASGEHYELSWWFAATDGEISARWVGPDGAPIASWHGRRGENSFARTLNAGHYVVEVTGAGRGLVGVKGPIITSCPVDPARVAEHPARPEHGFRWPYLLAMPKAPRTSTLLIVPNSTGVVTEDLGLLRSDATCELARVQAIAEHLGTPVMIPLFPRPAVAGPDEDLYLHALSRAALTTTDPRYARVDLQLVAMIDDARATVGPDVDRRVLITGFSASGSFANRFAVLHPDRVLAAAVGSPGGWPIAPTSGEGLTYPVGVSDLAQLVGSPPDFTALRGVHFFFFIGDRDENDAVPYRDSFSPADEALIMQRFGKTPVARWDAARQLYKAAGLDADFKLYPGVGHEQTDAMTADIEAAFAAALHRR